MVLRRLEEIAKLFLAKNFAAYTLASTK